MRACVLAFLMVMVVSTQVAAQETRPAMTGLDKFATGAFLAGAAADWTSHATCVTLSPHCHEMNPALNWAGTRNVPVHIAIGATADVLSAYAVNRWIRPRHPKLARLGFALAAAGRFYLASSNVRLTRQMGRCNGVTIPNACRF